MATDRRAPPRDVDENVRAAYSTNDDPSAPAVDDPPQTEPNPPMSSESAFQDTTRVSAPPQFSTSPHLHDETREEQVPTPKRGRARKAVDNEETQQLLTLFAYHRDPVRVAQELRLNASELQERIESLGLRRRVNTILERTTDIELFKPQRTTTTRAPSAPKPLVRKRGEKPEARQEPVEEKPVVATPEEPGIRWEPREKLDREEAAQKKGRKRAVTSLTPRREYVQVSTRSPKAAAVKAPKRKKKKTLVASPPANAEKQSQPGQTAPEPELKFELKYSIQTLFDPAARGVVENLLETEKANPRILAQKLSETYEGPLGRELTDEDLRAIVEIHGFTESFAEKEAANTRFLIGFHQGARGKLANALGLAPSELGDYLARLGLTADLERTRAERARLELGRNRLRDRLLQVLTRAPYLDDLGVLPVIDREVKDKLLEFFDAHRAEAEDAEALEEKVREETALEPNPFNKLLRRYELQDHAKTLLED